MLKKVISVVLVLSICIGLIVSAPVKSNAESGDIVMDNGDPGYSEYAAASAWATSTSSLGQVGASHRYINTTKGSYATWVPPALTAGEYKVYINKVVHSTNDPNTEVTVFHQGIQAAQTMNTALGTSGYQLLGAYQFNGSGSEYVRLTSKTDWKAIRADAVKFTPIAFDPQLNMAVLSSTSISLRWNTALWATGYKLYRSTSVTGGYGLVYSGIDTGYTDTTCSGGTTYYYKVSAYDSEAESSSYGPVTGTTLPSSVSIAFDDSVTAAAESLSVAASVYSNNLSELTGLTVNFSATGNGTALMVTPSSTVLGSSYSRESNGYYYFDIPVSLSKSNAYGDIAYTVTAQTTGQTGTKQFNYLNPPSAPTGLQVGNTRAAGLQLSWTAGSSASGYRLYRSTVAEGPYSKVFEGEQTAFLDTEASVGYVYYYTVSSVNQAGESAQSAPVSVSFSEVIIDNGEPGYGESTDAGMWTTSVNTTFGALNNHRYNNTAGAYAYWVPSVPAGDYKVYINRVVSPQYNDANAEVSIVHAGITEPVQKIDLTPAGGTFGFKLLGAYRFTGSGSESVRLTCRTANNFIRADAVKFVPLLFNPALQAQALSYSSVSLNWNSASWATGYKLYRSTSPDGGFTMIYEGADPGYTDTGLNGDTVYYYKVSAFDDEVSTSQYGPVNATTMEPPLYIKFAENMAVTEDSFTVTASVYGNDLSELTGKNVTFSAYGNGMTLFVSPESLVLGSTPDRVENGMNYFDIPVSVNKSSEFGDVTYEITGVAYDQTAVRQFTCKNAPGTPMGLEPAFTSDSAIQMIWNSSNGADSYKLYRALSPDGPYVSVYEGAESIYTDTGVQANSTYYYKIAGINPVGESALSASVAGTARNSLTLNMPAAASQYYIKTPPQSALDGDPDTMWRNLSLDANKFLWLEVDLGRRTSFDKAVMKMFKNEIYANYKIQYSDDGINWNDAFVKSTPPDTRQAQEFDPISKMEVNTCLEVANFDEVSARYVRFYAEKSRIKVWGGLYSFDVYGSEAGLPWQYDGEYERLSNISITGNSLDFDPMTGNYTVQMLQSGTINIQKACDGQKVYIDGVEALSKQIDPGSFVEGGRTVTVTAVSTDGTNRMDYVLELMTNPSVDSQFQLSWSDEFNDTAVDTDKWDYRDLPRFEGNNRPENISVGDGMMHIALKKETTVGKDGNTYQYSSGGLISRMGLGYGYYETRAKLWGYSGFHSSFWLYGVNEIPPVLEIDGFEVDSQEPDKYVPTASHYYYPEQYSTGPMYYNDVDTSDGYHIYGFEWTPDRVKFFVDGKMIGFRLRPGPGLPQNLWLTSLAMKVGDTPIDDSQLPGEVTFDYVRYYAKVYDGVKVPDGAIVVDPSSSGYAESGNWGHDYNAYPYTVSPLTYGSQSGAELQGYENGGSKRVTRATRYAGDSVTWTPDITDAGKYEVAVWNPGISLNTANRVKYTIHQENQSTDVYIDPMYAGQKFVSLGQYDFTAGTNGYLTLTAIDGRSSVYNTVYTRADAAIFIKVPDAPQNLRADTAESGNIRLNWDEVQNSTKYNVYKRSIADGTWSRIGTVAGYNYYDTGSMVSVTTNSFKVTAVNDWVESNMSAQLDVSALPSVPTPTPTPTPTPASSSAPGHSQSDSDKVEVTNEGSVKVDIKPQIDDKTGEVTVSMAAETFEKALKQIKDGVEGVKQIEIEVAEVKGATRYTVQLPKAAVAAEGATLTTRLITPAGSVVIPSNMFSGSAFTGNDIAISIGLVDTVGMDNLVKSEIGRGLVIEIFAKVDGKRVEWSNQNASVTVSLPYKPTAEELEKPEHIVVWYIDEQGRTTPVPSGKYDPATGMVTFRTSHFSKYAVAYVIKTFDDIKNYEWARTQIEALASKGITQGTSAKTFEPGGSITRADFVLLLVRTLGLTASVEGNFADVKENDYYEGLGIAKVLGIVNVTDGSMFNPGTRITRQDMMTMVARALKITGKMKTTANTSRINSYHDLSSVSSYAAESVTYLINEGLIQGNGNLVKPLDITTRAEAAVLMYRIYNY